MYSKNIIEVKAMYRKTQHSVYSITLHLVLVVKYRRNVIDDVISKRIKDIFESIGSTYGIEILEWNHDKDHIHTMLSISPSTNLNKYINAAKAASSRLIKKEFPSITLKLWKETFWTRGFYVHSTGSKQTDAIKNYISNQGEKQC